MTNTNNGFDTLHLSNQLVGTRDGIWSLSNQLCNCCSDINSNIANGFYTAEVSACNRQIADMNQNFTNQLNLQNNLNQLGSRLDDCCCENRLGIANLNSTILSENCADRYALAEGIRDIITNQTSNTQRILDQLCNDKIDAKNEKITDLQRELLMKDLQASQIQQTATLRLGQEAEVDALYNRLSNCPVPTTPVYGRTPIFTCPNNNGCGCNNGYYATNLI
jgi:flagellar biosynthesis chaperone FliJ